MENYKTLEKVFKKISDIDQAQSVLHWDMAVKMPSGGAEARAEQLATLQSITHGILTDDGVYDLYDGARNNSKKLNGWQQANLKEMGRVLKHANAVPKELLTELTRAGSKCEMVWREARANNDFKILQPHLEKVVKISREIAKVKGEAFGCSPYEALLDQYDPGRKESQLDKIFDDLKGFLPDFITAVVEKQKADGEPTELQGPFNIEKQKKLGIQLLENLGFDFDQGRLDESHHPFCGGYQTDIRITTRYDENDFTSALMGVMHEGGHAMYEAGLPKKWQGQPIGDARGMSIHESQSLLIEMQACRSAEFLKYAIPVMKKTLGAKGKGWSFDNIYKLYTRVEPSLIRVDADEVTYPAHVMLRYYIEKYLISGEMEVADLPDAWNQGMEKFLGVKPDSDKNGCMQDIHWMDGSFGYFPTYTLGAIYASQLFAAAKKADETITPSLAKGDFKPIVAWLNKNIHEKGCKQTTEALIKSATGSALDVNAYKEYLKGKYLD